MAAKILSSPQYPEAAPTTAPGGRTRGVGRKATLIPAGAQRGIAEVRPMASRTQFTKPFLGKGDLVMVTNIETDTWYTTPNTGARVDVQAPSWDFIWDRRTVVVAPGETKPVPFPAVVNALGDPRSVEGEVVTFHTEDGDRGVIVRRYDSLMQLCAKYGVEEENIDALVEFAPKLRVTTITGSVEITFPAQDPRHTPYPIPQVAEPGREQPIDTREAIQRMEAERDDMRNQLAQMRSLIEGRFAPEAGTAGTATPSGPGADELAAAMGGAIPDSGPRTGI